jgi:hypothetical protein
MSMKHGEANESEMSDNECNLDIWLILSTRYHGPLVLAQVAALYRYVWMCGVRVFDHVKVDERWEYEGERWLGKMQLRKDRRSHTLAHLNAHWSHANFLTRACAAAAGAVDDDAAAVLVPGSLDEDEEEEEGEEEEEEEEEDEEEEEMEEWEDDASTAACRTISVGIPATLSADADADEAEAAAGAIDAMAAATCACTSAELNAAAAAVLNASPSRATEDRLLADEEDAAVVDDDDDDVDNGIADGTVKSEADGTKIADTAAAAAAAAAADAAAAMLISLGAVA